MTASSAPAAPPVRFGFVHYNSTGLETFCPVAEELGAELLTVADGQTLFHGNRHLSLLLGARFCLAASLARLEGSVAFGELARRHPRMALTAEPTWACNPMLRGVSRLVVALEGER